jgi:hypothetical protein
LALPAFASEPTVDRTDRDAVRARIAERYERGDRVATIAEQEGVCVKTVRNIARRRGIPRRRPDQRERDARIATRYAAGERVASIADSEGVRTPYVRAVGRRYGIPPRSGWQRRYPLDETAFDEPSPIGWWLIGLLAADGSINEREHRVSLAQRAADSDVLHAFLAYVASPRPLTDLRLTPSAAARAWPRTPAQEARVFSANMCRALAAHGIVPRKTHRMRFSDQAAAEPAVWLGMFDGDGSGGPRRAAGRPRLDWYGTRVVMEQCSAFWGARLELQTGRAPRVLAHAGGLSKVALHGSNAALAARILLDASPISMDRKRRALEEIVHYRPCGRPVADRSTNPGGRHGSHKFEPRRHDRQPHARSRAALPA